MDDERADASQDQRRREGLLVLFGVFMVGLILIGAADRLHHLGPTVGNTLFAALPLVAAAAAAAWLRQHR